jgi:uncharacterized protein YceK
MSSVRRRIVSITLALLLASGSLLTVSSRAVASEAYARRSHEFNDQYIFATTRSVNGMDDVNPALKLTLFPVTIVLDTVFLPFAVIAGFVG